MPTDSDIEEKLRESQKKIEGDFGELRRKKTEKELKSRSDKTNGDKEEKRISGKIAVAIFLFLLILFASVAIGIWFDTCVEMLWITLSCQ